MGVSLAERNQAVGGGARAVQADRGQPVGVVVGEALVRPVAESGHGTGVYIAAGRSPIVAMQDLATYCVGI